MWVWVKIRPGIGPQVFILSIYQVNPFWVPLSDPQPFLYILPVTQSVANKHQHSTGNSNCRSCFDHICACLKMSPPPWDEVEGKPKDKGITLLVAIGVRVHSHMRCFKGSQKETDHLFLLGGTHIVAVCVFFGGYFFHLGLKGYTEHQHFGGFYWDTCP